MNFKKLLLHQRPGLFNGLIAAFLICLMACEELPVESGKATAKEFLIAAGAHYATPKLMETTEAKRIPF